GLCLSRSNYDVEIEHWMLKILELNDTDISRLLRYYEIDGSKVIRDLTRTIDRFKTGNTRPPSLSPKVVDLVQQGWFVASIEFSAPAVRSGHLLLALLTDESLARLTRDGMPDLAKISAADLKKEMRDITSGSEEDVALARAEAAAGGAAAGPAMGGKTPALD